MDYQVKKTILGKATVHFFCPHCLQEVVNPLDDAGTNQACPSCSKQQRVPGTKEKAEAMAQAARQKELERKKLADKLHAEQLNKNQRPSKKPVESPAVGPRSTADLHRVQREILTVDWSDRIVWRAFYYLRRVFAVQLAVAIFIMIVGSLLMITGACFAIYEGVQPVPMYANAAGFALLGLIVLGSGYGLYLITAALAVLVYIERNTRGILKV